MKIMTRDQLAKMPPNGTVFSYFDGDNIEGFKIITGRYDDGKIRLRGKR